MRIALVCDWFLPRVGGIEAHLGDLARELARAGHSVDVLTPMPPDGGLPADETLPGGVRVRRTPVPLVAPWGLAVPTRARATLDALLARGHYDVVHAHASLISPFAVAGAWAACARALPCVVTHHSVLGRGARVLAAADRVLRWSTWPVLQTAVSDVVARELRAAVPGLDVTVLPNAIHPDAWALPRPARAPGAPLRVVSVMRLARRKRPRALVRAVARMRGLLPAGTPLEVVVAGDGPERARAERLARRLGVADAIRFVGWQSRDAVRALFATSDAFVLPSVLESFGIAALEARCAGLPVVAMHRAGVAGFVRHEREGLLAADDEELAHHLARLVTDDALRERIAEHNRRTRPAETWARVLARHEQVYRRAIGVAGRTKAGPRRAHAARAG